MNPSPLPAPTDHLAYQTRTMLHLPFGIPKDGTWYVAWGRRDAIHNYHVISRDKRFAYDFVVVHGQSKAHVMAAGTETSTALANPCLLPPQGPSPPLWIRFKKGDQVRAGDQLGECGNSGNSSLPHLHYHLQTGNAFQQGVGLPAFVDGYFRGGQLVKRGEPVRGDIIFPARIDPPVTK